MSTPPDQYIQHVNVMVPDMDEAAEFYAGFLGLEQLTPPQNQGFPCEFFRFNDHQEVHVNVLPDPVPVKAHFCLRVPNFEEIVREQSRAGVWRLRPGATFAVCRMGSCRGSFATRRAT